MSRRVALLRAVNVGGAGKLSMPALTAAAQEAGLEAPHTILQTGNLVFGTTLGPTAAETKIEVLLGAQFGLATAVMVRSADEWRRIVADNPFAEAARSDPAHLVLLVLKTPPRADGPIVTGGREQIKLDARHAYVTYPDGIGRSKFTLARIERHLATQATGRNWSTVLKIAAALDP